MKYWGGGVVCAEMIWKEHAQVVDLVGFGDGMVSGVPSAECTGNGKVILPYGSAEYSTLVWALAYYASSLLSNYCKCTAVSCRLRCIVFTLNLMSTF